jgi:hypothetical protein
MPSLRAIAARVPQNLPVTGKGCHVDLNLRLVNVLDGKGGKARSVPMASPHVRDLAHHGRDRLADASGVDGARRYRDNDDLRPPGRVTEA